MVLIGCQSTAPNPVPNWVAQGEYGQARDYTKAHLTEKPSDRRYLLDRMQLAILTLDDGHPQAAGATLADMYELLRTQGINRDKTVASVVINEDLKVWKGEPFEQALAIFYYGLQQAMLGAWDNTRAAAESSLFNLKDFGTSAGGERIDTLDIAQRSLEWERAQAGRSDGKSGDYLNSGYAVRESNFTLGYLLKGIAAQQMGRVDEARDNFAVALKLNPALRPVVDQLAGGDYNTVLVVAYGLGPKKVAYGPDDALARFAPRFHSDARPLVVNVDGRVSYSFPVACDVNALAADHMWNNLEDVRQAKSILGNVFLIGGLGATAIGAHNHSDEAVYAGLGAAALGLFMKAGAHADTRYCEVLPQRFYVVPLKITAPAAPVMLQVEAAPQSRLMLTGLSAPPDRVAQLRLVRLVSGATSEGHNGTGAPPAWAVSGQVLYANDVTGDLPGQQWPYILGGNCVRQPTHETLLDYQRGGRLRHLTTNQVLELYRQEGIQVRMEDHPEWTGRHVLEGGKSLVAPLGGTTGFTRLFGQTHQPYQPQSPQVQQLARQVTAGGSGEVGIAAGERR